MSTALTTKASTIRLSLADDDAALSRLLGVIRRRGFSIQQLSAAQDEKGRFSISVDVRGARPVEALMRHLACLIDVEAMRLEAHPECISV